MFLYSLTSIFLFLEVAMSSPGVVAPSASANRVRFSSDLFQTIATENTQKNVIFSPVSVQAAVALLYFGANGRTAEEIRNALRLGAGSNDDLAENYGQFLKQSFAVKKDGPQLNMATRIFVNEGVQLNSKFNEISKKYFNAEAEQLPFANSAAAVGKINSWVEQKTQNKIQNLLGPDAVDKDTTSVLVNAIYFKGLWNNPFSASDTSKSDFTTFDNKIVAVDMMYNDDSYKYAELPDLDAKALELPYKNSDMSMLILLPNKQNGLVDLENKLSKTDLHEIASTLKLESVTVSLPKFKIEFDINLKTPLNKLGIRTAFSDNADLSNLFTSTTGQKVSEAWHKAYLEVNEAGSEAAAATFLKMVPMSLNLNQKHFVADHPFVFAIRNQNAVFFAGHLSTF